MTRHLKVKLGRGCHADALHVHYCSSNNISLKTEITVTATCVGAESTNQELVEKRIGRRAKREAILITGYPPNNFKMSNSNQRATKLRYWHKKPKRGSLKPAYGPPPSSPNRLSVKKYKKKQLRSKYNKYGKRNAKPRYPSANPYYGLRSQRPSKPRPPQPVYPQEPVGFGEPPKELAQEYVQPPKQSYGEPPVDSYGNPLSNNIPSGLSTFEYSNPNFSEFDQHQFQSLRSYNQDAHIDTNNAYSKHHPVYAKPEPEEYELAEPQKHTQFKFDSYADVYKHSPINPIKEYQPVKQSIKHHEHHTNDFHNVKKYKPLKGKPKANEYDNRDHVVVGGQYAEPPGRLVPNYHHQDNPHYQGDEGDSYVESALISSTSISPYINYKHSNMAFSPQNLNDAFSPFFN
ncbi:uncharacterized protein LOC125232339 [Leguminivora glycinivorella]|uniref:uncharacterized protein LOC125232339 n=1 Tax=Leguminivora glycinivorella TaxID=1035111 RepID=UPI00200BDC80|nr:uncharacterized protein LOC125232339 [Leguminivora glycinivorella]